MHILMKQFRKSIFWGSNFENVKNSKKEIKKIKKKINKITKTKKKIKKKKKKKSKIFFRKVSPRKHTTHRERLSIKRLDAWAASK